MNDFGIRPFKLKRPDRECFRVTEQLGDAEPAILFPNLGGLTSADAYQLLDNRLHQYASVKGNNVLAGTDDTWFDVWKNGKRVAVVRIEPISS